VFGDVLTVFRCRLMKEVKDFCKEKADGVSAFPDNAKGILFWKAKIVGAAGTPYAGQTYELQLEFPEVARFFFFLEKKKKKKFKIPCPGLSDASSDGDVRHSVLPSQRARDSRGHLLGHSSGQQS
jgi:uncharacterized protein Usg